MTLPPLHTPAILRPGEGSALESRHKACSHRCPAAPDTGAMSGAEPAAGAMPGPVAVRPAQRWRLWEQAAGRETRVKPSPVRRPMILCDGGRGHRMHPGGLAAPMRFWGRFAALSRPEACSHRCPAAPDNGAMSGAEPAAGAVPGPVAVRPAQRWRLWEQAAGRETRAKPSPERRIIVLCRSGREHRMHSATLAVAERSWGRFAALSRGPASRHKAARETWI